MRVFSALLAVAGGILLITSDNGGVRPRPPLPPEPIGDVLAECYAADRVARVEMLRRMQAEEFAGDQAKADWHNDESRKVIQESYRPYVDALAEALAADRLDEFIGGLER